MAALEEEDDYEEVLDEDGDLEGDEEDLGEDEDLDDSGASANAFFAAQHRRASVGRRTVSQASKYKSKRSFAELPGGKPEDLTEAVHALLERPTGGLSQVTRERFRPQYAEWTATLHAGFSLLLHGFGSKKELLEDFAAGLEKHDAPVVVLQGYSSGARVRDLLLTILTQVLKVQQPPTGSARALGKQGAASSADELAPGAPAAPASAARISPGGARDVGLADDEEEAAEATAEAEATARSEAVLSPAGVTNRERRMLRMLADSEHYAGAGVSTTGKLLDGSARKRRRDHGMVARDECPGGSPFEPSPVVELPGARRMLRARQPMASEMLLAAEDGLGFARSFNWVWAEAATGASYAHESADSIHELLESLYELANGAEGHSAAVVLGHLTDNAVKIFKMIIKYQLDNPRAAGLAFAELYTRARAQFFATSESALRKHINEFTTHDLVRSRAGPGGQQVYWCHFPGEVMTGLLNAQQGA